MHPPCWLLSHQASPASAHSPAIRVGRIVRDVCWRACCMLVQSASPCSHPGSKGGARGGGDWVDGETCLASLALRWLRILSMTTGYSMQAITFTGPWHFSHSLMSMLKT